MPVLWLSLGTYRHNQTAYAWHRSYIPHNSILLRACLIYIPLWLYYNYLRCILLQARFQIYIPLWLYYNPSGQPNRQPHIKTLTFCLSHFIRTQHSYFFTLLILKNSLLSSRFHLLSLPHIIYIITRRQSQKPTCLIFFYANKLLLQPTFIPR